MVTIEYEHVMQYSHDVHGRLCPRVTLRVTSLARADQSLDLDAHLDSGAEMSLFDGTIGSSLGIDLLNGREKRFQSTNGAVLSSRLHQVRLFHPALGSFDLEVAFSTSPIARNLLGRDFFRRVQIGFRESHATFYVTAQP